MSGTLPFALGSHLHFSLCRYYEFAKEHGIAVPTLEKKGFVKYEGTVLVADCWSVW